MSLFRLLGKLGPALQLGILFPSKHGYLFVRGVDTPGYLKLCAWSMLDDQLMFTAELDWCIFADVNTRGACVIEDAFLNLAWSAHNKVEK